jgi:phage shock protein PspC (stress-responsive transcriptional regulator)
MTRRTSAFVAFWYDFIVGDDWRIVIGVVAALALAYGLSNSIVPSWWVLPATVVTLLPVSLWRVARKRQPPQGRT